MFEGEERAGRAGRSGSLVSHGRVVSRVEQVSVTAGLRGLATCVRGRSRSRVRSRLVSGTRAPGLVVSLSSGRAGPRVHDECQFACEFVWRGRGRGVGSQVGDRARLGLLGYEARAVLGDFDGSLATESDGHRSRVFRRARGEPRGRVEPANCGLQQTPPSRSLGRRS